MAYDSKMTTEVWNKAKARFDKALIDKTFGDFSLTGIAVNALINSGAYSDQNIHALRESLISEAKSIKANLEIALKIP